jgi:hypothetical protein
MLKRRKLKGLKDCLKNTAALDGLIRPIRLVGLEENIGGKADEY